MYCRGIVSLSPRDDMTAEIHHAKVMLVVALNATKNLLRWRSRRAYRWRSATQLGGPYEASVRRILRAAQDDMREWSRESGS